MQNPFAALAKPQPNNPKGGSTANKKKKNRRKRAAQEEKDESSAFDSANYEQQQDIPEDAELVIVEGQKYYFPRTQTPSVQKDQPSPAKPPAPPVDDFEPANDPPVSSSRLNYSGSIPITFEEPSLPNKTTSSNGWAQAAASGLPKKPVSLPPATLSPQPATKAPSPNPTPRANDRPSPQQPPVHIPSPQDFPPVSPSPELKQEVHKLQHTVATLGSSLADAVAANQKTEQAVYSLQQVVTVLAQENRELRQQMQSLLMVVLHQQQQQTLAAHQPIGFAGLLPQQNGGLLDAEQKSLSGQRTFLKSLLEQINTANGPTAVPEPKVEQHTSFFSHFPPDLSTASPAIPPGLLPPGLLDFNPGLLDKQRI